MMLQVRGWAWGLQFHLGKIYCYETMEDVKTDIGL
jgi:hypothetical protein